MSNNIFRYKLNIYLMYGYWFFHNFIFAYVIERLYWVSRGMSNQQVVYTEIVYAVVIMLLEIPTGSLADKWSKKFLMIVSAILSSLEFVVLIYAKSFFHFAFAVAIAAVGTALSSGTSNALIFESLKVIGNSQDFEKVSGKVSSFDYAAAMLAGIAGSIVASTSGYVTTYWISLISMLISVVLVMFLTETNMNCEMENNISYLDTIKEAAFFLKSKDSIRFMLIFGTVTAAVYTYIDEFWQVYLNEIGIPVVLFGVVSSSRTLSASISGAYAYKIKEKFSYDSILSSILGVLTLSILITSFTKSYLGIIPFMIASTVFGVIEPIVLGYLHHRVENNIRATVESFQSLILRGVTIICGLVFGYFSTQYSILTGFRVLAFILTVYLLYYLRFRRRYLYKKKTI